MSKILAFGIAASLVLLVAVIAYGDGPQSSDVAGGRVIGLRGFPIAPVNPVDGQTLTYSGTSQNYVPTTASGGGGSGISGLTAGQVGVAGSATTLTSSIPVSATSGNGTIVETGGGGKIANGFMTGVLACADLTNGATGCSTATGTSGATIGLLNGNKTDSGTNSFTGANNTFTAMAGVVNTLTISTATFTPVLGSGVNQAATLVHASCPCTMANPSDTSSHVGQTGVLVITQSSTGSDTVGTWGSQYVTPGGTSGITLSTAANAVDYLPYYVADATHVVFGTVIKGPTH